MALYVRDSISPPIRNRIAESWPTTGDEMKKVHRFEGKVLIASNDPALQKECCGILEPRGYLISMAPGNGWATGLPGEPPPT